MWEVFFILFTVKISFSFDAKKDTQELIVGNYLVPLSSASKPPYNPCIPIILIIIRPIVLVVPLSNQRRFEKSPTRGTE